MRLFPGGPWLGLGLGESSDEIRKIKAYMRRQFKSYAGNLSDTTLFDKATEVAVIEMQRRLVASGQIGEHTPGIINLETKYAMKYKARPPKLDIRPMLFTVSGTSVPWWVGPDADTARAVESRWRWQPIGYPAQMGPPMGPSIKAGRDELAVQMERWRERIETKGMALAGYSQGAIVTSEVFLHDIRPESGRLHWALPHIRAAVTWGNPCRERGKVWPDAGARPSPAENGGVTPVLMTDTPDWWRDYAHAGDLYTDCPDDESAENRRAIWQVIRDGSIIRGPDSLLNQIIELAGATDASAVSEVVGMAKAMFDGLLFFGRKTGPHINYSTREAVDYLMGAA